MATSAGSPSLWTLSADELLDQTASAAPVPGGGGIAAVAGALGMALVRMALAVTADPALDAHAARAEAFEIRLRAAADRDADAFGRVMEAIRMPRDGQAAETRRRAIEAASVEATVVPLELAQTLLEARLLAAEVEPLVKAQIVSDVQAGADIMGGAARAAVRTADVNLRSLVASDEHEVVRLRAHRQSIVEQLESQG